MGSAAAIAVISAKRFARMAGQCRLLRFFPDRAKVHYICTCSFIYDDAAAARNKFGAVAAAVTPANSLSMHLCGSSAAPLECASSAGPFLLRLIARQIPEHRVRFRRRATATYLPFRTHISGMRQRGPIPPSPPPPTAPSLQMFSIVGCCRRRCKHVLRRNSCSFEPSENTTTTMLE